MSEKEKRKIGFSLPHENPPETPSGLVVAAKHPLLFAEQVRQAAEKHEGSGSMRRETDTDLLTKLSGDLNKVPDNTDAALKQSDVEPRIIVPQKPNVRR